MAKPDINKSWELLTNTTDGSIVKSAYNIYDSTIRHPAFPAEGGWLLFLLYLVFAFMSYIRTGRLAPGFVIGIFLAGTLTILDGYSFPNISAVTGIFYLVLIFHMAGVLYEMFFSK